MGRACAGALISFLLGFLHVSEPGSRGTAHSPKMYDVAHIQNRIYFLDEVTLEVAMKLHPAYVLSLEASAPTPLRYFSAVAVGILLLVEALL